ncbi:polyprenol dehydrogenase-like isoform 2-T2 [Salvelinus alpinus]
MPGPLNYGYFLGIVSVELELPRQHGRGGIVTGGIRGNCFETARHMARLGAHIIIAGQHEREGVSTVKTIREENREAKGHSPHNPVWFCISLALDITDWLESEHTFSKWSLSSWIWRLCCQSGNSSRPSRDIIICPKLARVLFLSHLQQRLNKRGFPVSSCAVDPGMVDTWLYRHLFPPVVLHRQPSHACSLGARPRERLRSSTLLCLRLWKGREGATGATDTQKCHHQTPTNPGSSLASGTPAAD